ncbi:mediator of RNA polymerase II transcription subunit 15, partial [Biomphalaria glabrata]
GTVDMSQFGSPYSLFQPTAAQISRTCDGCKDSCTAADVNQVILRCSDCCYIDCNIGSKICFSE